MSSTPPETLNRIGAYRMRAESTFHKSLKELQAYQSAHPLDELILRNEAKWEMKNEPKLVEFKFKRQPYVRPEPKLGRNEPCPCHSGRKFKNCCLRYEANSREQPPLKLQPRPNCTVVELRAAVPDDRQCRWHVGRFGPG